ncbi:terminase large subunit domain-containing protein [Schaalia hyovaginalis]|uniref:terminase large subunit domain-containing protein n=1 Tax=Schaalia hyovaginalis TaxID=29316 RepID=UPI002A835031|nr:terminase family protein [Schaalia hyovaginalis]MDY3666271.1 phage terminase large subunit family protein [Schaalia hyovaginalis]
MSAEPRYATRPTDGAKHEAWHVGAMARLLGTPLMPWQNQVARVVTERTPDGLGWRYPTVVLTVPRQSGKTTLMRAIMAQRTLRYPRSQAFYSAQSGKDARERWADLVNAAELKFPDLVTIKRGAGAECMEWKNGRGQVRTFAPTRTALHGYTPELVMLDEAFAFDEDLGAALMAAIVPAQATLDNRQLWIVSTAGDADSAWLKEWVDRGREATQDPAARLAYFEWSAADDADLSDPAVIESFHPAVGETQTVKTILDARETMPAGEFARAFGNIWSTTKTAVIDPEILARTTNTEQTPPTDPTATTFAYEVSRDRSWATIWAAWTDPEGHHLRPYLSQPGTWWLLDTLADLYARGSRLAADDGGPARSITEQARLNSLEVLTLGARDFAAATGDLIEALTTGTVDHNGDPALLDAVNGAALRRLGEADAWSRRDSQGPIWELIAATVALRAHTYIATQAAPLIIGISA